MKRSALPSSIIWRSTRSTLQPRTAASQDFSQSLWMPSPRLCLPADHVAPSTSTATRYSGHAKSNRNRRRGVKRCSRSAAGRCATLS